MRMVKAGFRVSSRKGMEADENKEMEGNVEISEYAAVLNFHTPMADPSCVTMVTCRLLCSCPTRVRVTLRTRSSSSTS